MTEIGERKATELAKESARPGRLRRTVVVLAGLVVVVGTGVIAPTSLGDEAERIPGAFAPLQEAPRPAATEATTFLVVGTDTRTAEATDGT